MKHDLQRFVPGLNGLTHEEIKNLMYSSEWNTAKAIAHKRAKPFMFQIDEESAVAAMTETWMTALGAMHKEGIHTAVIPAIGCGAFMGPFPEVPSLWCKALIRALAILNSDKIVRVIICFVKYEKDRYNFEQFQDVCSKSNLKEFFHLNSNQDYEIRQYLTSEFRNTELVLAFNASSIHTAYHYQKAYNVKVALLNPSDVYAVCMGNIAMFFDGGHIAVEELYGVHCTILLQHEKLNKDLWTNENRRINLTPEFKGAEHNPQEKIKMIKHGSLRYSPY